MIPNSQATEPLSPVKRALLEIRELRAQLAALESARQAPIAIVGMALRLPGGVVSLGSYWDSLAEGRSLVTEVPSERWDLDRYYSLDQHEAGKMYSRHGAFLEAIDQFDADFFSISGREAQSIDPQQRLLLEVAWEALEDGAIAPASLKASQTGVYLGLSNSDYGRMLLRDAAAIDTQSVVGGALSIAAGRLAYFFNLRGPAMVIDTACSSSLVALHLACNDLRSNVTDLAIVGGANLMLLPEASIGFSKTQMLSREGRCKVFDQAADGYVRGEGCVVIILKRLADAEAARLPIRSLIRGSAINQDGRSASLTAPNGPSQEAVLRSALKSANVEPGQVSYVECHGTGTPLGDPIEVQALANVYSGSRSSESPLLIGSVKANIGHLEAASGLAGLVKTVLSLEHKCLPPQVNFVTGNPHIPWAEISVRVVQSSTAWSRGAAPRIAGISSFGFSGTNAHVIVEEAPAHIQEPKRPVEPATQILLLSARTPQALKELALRYIDQLSHSTANLANLCFTSAVGRSHHRVRLTARGANTAELQTALGAWLGAENGTSVVTGLAPEGTPVVFLKIADVEIQGAESIANGLQQISIFRDAYEACLAVLAGVSKQNRQDRDSSLALQYALARLYSSWMVRPPTASGLNSGQYVAACIEGSLPLEQAMKLALAEISAERDAANLRSLAPDSVVAHCDNAEATSSAVWIDIGSVKAPGSSPDTVFVLAQAMDPWEALMASLQELYCRGVAIDWAAVYQQQVLRRVSLPTYPFQRKSYWMSPVSSYKEQHSDRPTAETTKPRHSPVSPRTIIPASATPAAKDAWIVDHVCQCIRKVLDLDPQLELSPRARLTDLGVDSLIALELRSLLSTSLGLGDKLASTAAFDAGTVEGLARMVSTAYFPPLNNPVPVDAAVLKTLTVEEISELSDEEVEQLLATRIGRAKSEPQP